MAGFVKNISINSLQLFINQALTLVVFLVLANSLDKADFGALNMILALLLTMFGILSFGIDQLVQRKMAGGEQAAVWLPLALMHNLVTGAGFYLLLVILSLFPLPFSSSALLLIALGKMAFSLSMPYKQVMAGLEKFNMVFKMSVASSMGKALGLLILFFTANLNLGYIALVFLVSDLVELFITIFLFNREMEVLFYRSGFARRYKELVKEALPQLGTVIFAAAMARFDWLFIGFFLSTSRLAEYSFAYRIFEISLFPMLVIAPLLVPGFTRRFKNDPVQTEGYTFLFRMEMLVASFILLLINILWEPFAGFISDGKYGAVNSFTVLILSLSMPLLYYNNFLWSVHFAKGRTRFILKVFAGGFLLNVIGNLVFIPLWGNEGAAAAYLLAILFQTIIYHMHEPFVRNSWKILILTSLAALAGILVSGSVPGHFSIPMGFITYACLLVISKQVFITDGRQLKEFRI